MSPFLFLQAKYSVAFEPIVCRSDVFYWPVGASVVKCLPNSFSRELAGVLLNPESWYEVSTAGAKSKNEKRLVLWSFFKLWLQFNEATKRQGIVVNGPTVISGQTGADTLPFGSCNRAYALFGVGAVQRDVSHLDCTRFSMGWSAWWTVCFSRLETFVDLLELDRVFV